LDGEGGVPGGARRGLRTHPREVTTACHNKIVQKLRDHDLAALADLGFVGLDDTVGADTEADQAPAVITGKKAARNSATQLLRALLVVTP
jgi:hypothetical protein